jgi:hypothetical protein
MAETYKGIGPLDTLGDLKSKFPGAVFEKLDPAWAGEKDVLYSITGSGMSGTIVVKFLDSRVSVRQALDEYQPGGKDRDVNFYERWANEENTGLSVVWVRWIPDAPIPLQRFLTKYGPPEKSDFSEERLQPYKWWVSKGLQAYLSDDGKFVVRVDFEFTGKEYEQAFKAKSSYVPGRSEKTAPNRK